MSENEPYQPLSCWPLSSVVVMAMIMSCSWPSCYLLETDGLPGLARATTHELRQVKGIGEVKAAQIKAALELGRELSSLLWSNDPSVRSPAEAANLLMPEMSNLEQEHTGSSSWIPATMF